MKSFQNMRGENKINPTASPLILWVGDCGKSTITSWTPASIQRLNVQGLLWNTWQIKGIGKEPEQSHSNILDKESSFIKHIKKKCEISNYDGSKFFSAKELQRIKKCSRCNDWRGKIYNSISEKLWGDVNQRNQSTKLPKSRLYSGHKSC